MENSSNRLFTECSTPEFIDRALRALEDDEQENQDAVMACLISHVDKYAHEKANLDGRFNDITYGNVAAVAKSLYVGIKHEVSIPPYKG